MPNPEPTDPFADRLRAAAEIRSPTFSPERHAAVMRRVQQHRPATVRPPRHRRAAARWAVAGLAAAVAAGVGTWAMRSTVVEPLPVHRAEVGMSLPALPSWSDAAWTVSRPIARQWADARLDVVDRSAGRFARYCIDQLDVFPIPNRPAIPTTAATDDGVDRS